MRDLAEARRPGLPVARSSCSSPCPSSPTPSSRLRTCASSALPPVATGLAALIIFCRSLGERQERPARPALRLLVFVLVTACVRARLGYRGALAEGPDAGWAYLPLAFVAGLLAQAPLSPNTGLRRLPQPLLRWRAPWRPSARPARPATPGGARGLALAPPARGDGRSAGGGFVGNTLRLGWLEALWAAPWAVAWFGYGVPVLLHRRSALVTALTLGLLTWLLVIHRRCGS